MFSPMIKVKKLVEAQKFKKWAILAIVMIILGTTVFSLGHFNNVMEKKEQIKNPQPQPVVKKQNADFKKSALTTAVPEQMVWPGKGEVIEKFGFIYSETFDDRRYHTGIDIKLPPGYEVRAALSGNIKSIVFNPLWGDEIVISHPGELETCYKGLKPQNINEGQKVVKGQPIGIITSSPKYEAKMEPHLHFEVLEKGKYVNPLKLLP